MNFMCIQWTLKFYGKFDIYIYIIYNISYTVYVYYVLLCLHGIHMFLGTKVVPSIVEVISGAQ